MHKSEQPEIRMFQNEVWTGNLNDSIYTQNFILRFQQSSVHCVVTCKPTFGTLSFPTDYFPTDIFLAVRESMCE